jgi:hypothetical protein
MRAIKPSVPKLPQNSFASDVLDHLSARARNGAVGEHERCSDHQIPDCAVAMAKRTGVPGRHDSPDGGVAHNRRIQSEHLARLREFLLSPLESHPRLDDRGQIPGVVLDDLCQARRRERNLRWLDRLSPIPLGAAAGKANRSRGTKDLRGLGHAFGSNPPHIRAAPQCRRPPADVAGTDPGPRRTASGSA